MTRRPQGPGGFDLNSMMKQVQRMQAEMSEAQEKLKDEVVEASAGGGMVKVTMSGDLKLQAISIAPEAIDPEEPELLQDMVTAAVNEAPEEEEQRDVAAAGVDAAVIRLQLNRRARIRRRWNRHRLASRRRRRPTRCSSTS